MDNQAFEKPATAVEVALANRQSQASARTPTVAISRITIALFVAVAIVLIYLILAPRMAFDASVRELTDRLNHPARTESDEGGGLGFAPPVDSAVVAQDAARKVNARRLESALAQFFAQNNRYPSSLDELDPSSLGFIPDHDVYLYTGKQGNRGYRLEVTFQSDKISGPNIVKDGEVTKYVAEDH